MNRTAFAILTCLAVGCATTGDRVAPTVVVVPEDGSGTNYDELLPKLRTLSWQATEAFYRDRWDELEQSAVAIDKAVKALRQTKNVPARVAPDLAARCDELSAECRELKSAVAAKSPEKTSDHLQKIHLLVRELRSES